MTRIRFSLLTLMLAVFAAGSGYGIWRRWEPWAVESTLTFERTKGRWAHELSLDGKRAAVWDEVDHPVDFAAPNVSTQLSVYDVASRTKLCTFTDLPQILLVVAFSPDGKMIGTISPGQLRIWDAESGKTLRRYEILKQNQAQFSPDSKKLLIMRQHLYNPEPMNDAVMIDLEEPADAAPRALKLKPHNFVWSPDGTQLLLHDVMGTEMTLVSTKTLDVIKSVNAKGPVYRTWYSQNGKKVLAIGGTSEVVELDASNLNELSRTRTNAHEINFLHEAPEGRWLAYYNLQRLRRLDRPWVFQMEYPRVCGVTPDGARIIATAQDSSGKSAVWPIFVIDADDGRIVERVEANITGTAVVSPDCNRVIGENFDGIRTYVRRRPPGWTGIVWLPETWIGLAAVAGMIWNVMRGRRAGARAQ